MADKVEFIAELGINHGGDMHLAQDMIVAAKISGADIAKFQRYNPLKILGKDSPYLEEASKAQFTQDQHKLLKEFCDHVDIEYCCSVFHEEDIPFFESIGMKRYKIASRSVNDLILLRAIKATGKPAIASNGLDKLLTNVKAIFEPRAKLSVLECISQYPTQLGTMKELLLRKLVIEDFSYPNKIDGISSHCPSILPTLAAILYGASIIEHHVRFSWQRVGCDMSSSITFEQLKSLIDIARSEFANFK